MYTIHEMYESHRRRLQIYFDERPMQLGIVRSAAIIGASRIFLKTVGSKSESVIIPIAVGLGALYLGVKQFRNMAIDFLTLGPKARKACLITSIVMGMVFPMMMNSLLYNPNMTHLIILPDVFAISALLTPSLKAYRNEVENYLTSSTEKKLKQEILSLKKERDKLKTKLLKKENQSPGDLLIASTTFSKSVQVEIIEDGDTTFDQTSRGKVTIEDFLD